MRYVGYIPIAFLLFGMALGGSLAESAGVAAWVGGLAGAIVGYLGSRAILRRVYQHDLD